MRIRTILLTITAISASVFLANPSALQAHMGVESSTPANAQTLTESPPEAVITFDADVEIKTAVAQLRFVGGPDASVSEAVRRDVRTEPLTAIKAEGRSVSFSLPELDAGLYVIDWSVSEKGGHPNSSFILFKIKGGGSVLSSPLILSLIPFGIVVGVWFWMSKKRRAS